MQEITRYQSKGRIVWYNHDKGFGIAIPDVAAVDVLLHGHALLCDSSTPLFVGQRIWMEVEINASGGLEARSFLPVETGDPA